MRITKADQLNKLRRTKKNKYGAKKAHSKLSDRWFDSMGERDRGDSLKAREMNGEISDLQFQPVVELVEGFTYRPDFYYYEVSEEREIWEDFKGAETERFRTAKSLWRYHGPGILRITKRRNVKAPFIVVKEIFPIN